MLYNEVEHSLATLLQQPQKPDAIMAPADKLTTNCLRYFKKRKICVPDEITLIGFSNPDLTHLISPSLPVVRQPAFEMGQLSAELLIHQIESKRPVKEFEHHILPPLLCIRESTHRTLAR